jgi:hypothetical protein
VPIARRGRRRGAPAQSGRSENSGRRTNSLRSASARTGRTADVNSSDFGNLAAIALIGPVIGVAISLLVFYWAIRLAVRDGVLAARKRGARWWYFVRSPGLGRRRVGRTPIRSPATTPTHSRRPSTETPEAS